MVLKPEETREHIQFSDNSTGYLVCSECNGYYKLQGDETPEDFEKCECGSSLTYHETIAPLESNFKFSSTKSPDLIKSVKSSDEPADLDQLKKVEETKVVQTAPVSESEFIMNRFSPQKPVTEEVLNTLQQDKGGLWNNLNEFSSKKGYEHQKIAMDDVIEMNRLMMLVDQRRALEENNSPSRLKSTTTRMGPIGFLGASIVLLITVLILTLAGEMV
jgi:hypothetical protein